MPTTRSTTKIIQENANMLITEEVKDYFENLVKPLVTNKSLEDVLEKFTKEVISKFEGKIKEHEERITRLESTLSLRQNTIDILLAKVDARSDDNEQYSRRSCLRIHGVDFEENVRDENINKILSTFLLIQKKLIEHTG